MSNFDLSILLPARNEEWLVKTIEDLLAKIEGETEILVGLDGHWPVRPIPNHPKVKIVFYPESIGQRAMMNQLARLSKAKYLAKVDAHCSFDQGFDRKLMEDMQDDWTIVPCMRNLHAFDWVCPNGHRRYQGKSGICTECGQPTEKEVVWQPRKGTRNYSYCFDSQPHFQYFKEFSHRPEGTGELTESMSLQGSFFMCTREKYWELGLCDEAFGSWGSQGIEVACKTWLSGGRVMVSHKTWYAHLFRTQGGDFSFPYETSAKKHEYAKKYARELFFQNKWPKQQKPLLWLVEKFWPIVWGDGPTERWTEEDLELIRREDICH